MRSPGTAKSVMSRTGRFHTGQPNLLVYVQATEGLPMAKGQCEKVKFKKIRKFAPEFNLRP